ncbi:hypothetical protein K1719_027632 [Acacia pycnantha]|nr:hypothetical protein K1719_027632 [Acacia pycnantha]
MDMIAFSGCNEGCNQQEIDELTQMRYAFPWWKEKEIDSEKKRSEAGDIYKSERRMKTLKQAFPNLVKKETLVEPSELEPFQNHSNQI